MPNGVVVCVVKKKQAARGGKITPRLLRQYNQESCLTSNQEQ
jgi:hypothetical protein